MYIFHLPKVLILQFLYEALIYQWSNAEGGQLTGDKVEMKTEVGTGRQEVRRALNEISQSRQKENKMCARIYQQTFAQSGRTLVLHLEAFDGWSTFSSSLRSDDWSAAVLSLIFSPHVQPEVYAGVQSGLQTFNSAAALTNKGICAVVGSSLFLNLCPVRLCVQVPPVPPAEERHLPRPSPLSIRWSCVPGGLHRAGWDLHPPSVRRVAHWSGVSLFLFFILRILCKCCPF